MPDSVAPLPGFIARYRNVWVVGLHVLLLACLTSALYAFGIIRYLPSNDTLFRWDVIWYNQIREGGYVYSETQMSNAAFFPMLPYVWRLSGLWLLGMSLLNASLFLAASAWLAHQLRLPPRLQLLLLSTPSLLFMVVPYTEALFFVFSTLLVLGLRRRRLWWWLLGLLGCGLTRSASTMFTPALVFMVLMWAMQPGQRKTAIVWGASGLGALLLSIGLVATTQWYQTGEPLGFIRAQKHWGHTLRALNFPFSDPSGIDVLWLDAQALWLGVAAAGLCTWLAWRWLLQWRQQRAFPILAPEVIFALGYCVGVTLFILSYQGGSLWNIGRYIFATPFFVVLVAYQASLPAWPWRRYLLIALGTMLFWQVFGIYSLNFDTFSTGQAIWYFGLVTAYLVAYLAWRQLRWQREITMLLYVFNLVMLLHMLEGWLQYYVVQ
ncbi:hypothetical protein FY528_11785 [Hymenobacter lutimineralis]|uniref:DUF2029 domain-containing protein n=1 Tax=Hymenobacter lutimineralis TaxID=2606448 RepID=A0A5D6V266_9BACT|nr:hypothetical protein [Hymenobacter lutimineralis]TYZ08889.1 hypothetical protein FY528_11785 [Hymenobacter lutimineralis]